MPINRFDRSLYPEYVDTHVPLPFEQIGKLGEKMQGDFDLSNKNLQSANPIAKINASAPMKVFGPNGQGVVDANLDFNDERDRELTRLNAKATSIAQAVTTDKDHRKYKLAAQEYANDAAQTYARLNQRADLTKKIDTFNQTVAKNPGLATFRANDLIAYNTDYQNRINQARQQGTNPPEYNPFDIAENVDIPKNVKEYFDDLNPEVDEEVSKARATGATITTKYREGVFANKINNTFDSWYDQSEAGKANKLKSEYFFNSSGLNKNAPAINPTTGKPIIDPTTKEPISNQQMFDLQEKEKVKNLALGFTSSHGSDKLGNNAGYWNALKRADKIAEESPKIVTTNEQGNPETVNVGSVINGMNLGDVMNDKGEFITSGLHTTSGVVNPMGIVGVTTKDAKSPRQLAIEFNQKLITKSMELGLGKPADGDYKKQIYDYAVNVAKRRSTTSNLQGTTSKGLTNYLLGPTSNIHNMEFYRQGDEDSGAETLDKVNTFPNNSKITGIDWFGPNQAGYKVAVTTKNGDNSMDEPYLAVPKDKSFAEETKAVHDISRGVLEFAKTGKVNPKYRDQSYDALQTNVNNAFKTQFPDSQPPKLVTSSTKRNRAGEIIVRGSYVDNSTGTPEFKVITWNKTRNTINGSSLDEVQNSETQELETKGSLNQYNTSLKETVKPSEVDYDTNEAD